MHIKHFKESRRLVTGMIARTQQGLMSSICSCVVLISQVSSFNSYSTRHCEEICSTVAVVGFLLSRMTSKDYICIYSDTFTSSACCFDTKSLFVAQKFGNAVSSSSCTVSTSLHLLMKRESKFKVQYFNTQRPFLSNKEITQ